MVTAGMPIGVMLIFFCLFKAGIYQLIMHEIGWTRQLYIKKNLTLKHRQSKRRLSQCVKILPPSKRTAKEQHVVNPRPQNRMARLRSIRLRQPVRLNHAPDARQAHGIAKRVDENDGQQRPRPQEEEVCQGAEQGRVRELEDGAGNGGHEGGFWVRDAELVKVMDVGEAKDDGGQEDDSIEAGAGHQQQRDGGSAEETFFSDGALNKKKIV